MHFYWFRPGIPRASSIVFVKIMWKSDTFLYIYISVDWCNQKTASLYTYQSTDVIRKRHLYIHISRLMQSENGILLLFYIFLSHGNEKKNGKRGGSCVLSTSTCVRDNRNFDISNFEKKGVKSVEMHCDLFETTK